MTLGDTTTDIRDGTIRPPPEEKETVKEKEKEKPQCVQEHKQEIRLSCDARRYTNEELTKIIIKFYIKEKEKERERSQYSYSNRPRVSKDYRDPQKRSKGKSNGSDNGSAIRFKTSFRNVIYEVMKARGWNYTDSDMDWDIHWSDRGWMFEVFDYAQLESWQRVNHFRNDKELCRKDLLIKNIKRMRRNLEKEKKVDEAQKYDFCPTTYVLPREYALFAEEFKKASLRSEDGLKSSSNMTWIMKPIGKSQGRGIFLFQKLNQISKWRSETKWKSSSEGSDIEAYVVQRYISRPYLIGNKKFDIRLYVLVTSFHPLTVYLYRSGFARFGSEPYSATDVTNQYVHLTNVAVQKSSENYNKETGCKWDLRQLKLHLLSRHGHKVVDELFANIQSLCIRSLLSVQNVLINDKHCFELYGYDVMIDEDLKPWLIEVNASPSLSANTTDDYNLKFNMLNEMLDVVDIENNLTGEETQIGGFDLVYKGEPISSNLNSMFSTMLGCEKIELPNNLRIRNKNSKSVYTK